MHVLATALTGPSSLPRLGLAAAVICGCALVAGTASRRLAQPRVLGEIAAGLALGPSLLGRLLPGVAHFLFPPELSGKLDALAKLGVVLFIFFVGAEFRSALPRVRWRLVASIVGGSLVVPLLVGIGLAFPLFSQLHGETANHGAFVLFFGVATSITALPVLAAILDDLGLSAQRIGILALGCAVVTDVAAWCLLAVVTAETGSGGTGPIVGRLLGAAALAAGVLLVGTSLLRRCLAALPDRIAGVAYPLLAAGLALGLATATEHIGVSVIFGAFIAGLAFGGQAATRGRSLEQVRVLNRFLLLPIFFAAMGLRVDLRAGTSARLLAAGALVLAVATAAKLGGVSLAARAGGLGWRDSVALGFLLNTRGITEVVVLRVGYDHGLLSRDALGVLIVVALVATAATVPALRLLGVVTAGPLGRGPPAEVAEPTGATVSA
jgi:Kef-type K+ transport system membrane component KefB